MKLSDVIVKPILSEKINKQTEKANRYAFVVDRKANKLEIKKAVEQFYGVQVKDEIYAFFLAGLRPFKNPDFVYLDFALPGITSVFTSFTCTP